MDVLDAGVYVSKWEASVPRHTKMVLWGPLQAREMGLEGWDVQDGGETGFVLHNAGVHLTMGRATSTLIFVRRLEKAFLTIYFGGYPADAGEGQRRLDMQKVVGACQIFLGRLAKQPVAFELKAELALVDNVNDAVAGRMVGSPRATASLAERSPADRETRRLKGGNSGRPDAFSVEEQARPRRNPDTDLWEP